MIVFWVQTTYGPAVDLVLVGRLRCVTAAEACCSPDRQLCLCLYYVHSSFC